MKHVFILLAMSFVAGVAVASTDAPIECPAVYLDLAGEFTEVIVDAEPGSMFELFSADGECVLSGFNDTTGAVWLAEWQPGAPEFAFVNGQEADIVIDGYGDYWEDIGDD